jgi:hypothetical protein
MREMADGEAFLEDNGITPGNLGPLIAAKLRRQSILSEGGRQVVHIIGEAVLRTRVGNVTTDRMRGQLAHLAEAATLPGHELGVVPFAIAAPVAPVSGFVLYDDDLAVVETLAGRLNITDPDMIARYTRWLDLLHQSAITGTAAAELCRRTASELS